MGLRHLKKVSDRDKEAIVEALKSVLRTHDEVIFALLYGSIITPLVPEQYGDIDVALYVRPDELRIAEFVLESQIEAEIYRHLSSLGLNCPPIEVLVLNNAPYAFLTELFRGRYLVLKEDEEALTNFIEEIGGRSMANFHLLSESLREVTEV
jgi:predicted nucleotidyltransferase